MRCKKHYVNCKSHLNPTNGTFFNFQHNYFPNYIDFEQYYYKHIISIGFICYKYFLFNYVEE